MSRFDPDSYGPVIGALLGGNRLCPLGPGTPDREAQSRLDGLSAETAFAGRRVRDPDMAAGCVSALWLLHNDLDTSHRISQQIETPEGSYWHGIMHRREPDYGNSKYWFRRVGTHPIFESLRAAAAELATDSGGDDAAFLSEQTAWDPFAFIDLCEASARGRSGSESLCQQVQRAEWELLFDYCYRAAVGA